MFKIHKSYRLFGYDYSSSGNYFVTIVIKNRAKLLGEVVKNKMLLSPAGKYVEENILPFMFYTQNENPFIHNPYFINKYPHIFCIHQYAILPNHIHLIVEIINNENKEHQSPKGIQPLQTGSLSSFINHFKGNIKKIWNKNGLHECQWQPRFHDRIIRNQDEYTNIERYIIANVDNWDFDAENM